MSRSPLSDILYSSNQPLDHIVSAETTQESHRVVKKHKQVTFDVAGILLFLVYRHLHEALSLEVKHETKLSVRMSKFTETIDLLKSASSWDKFSLKRFGVDFERTTYTPLTSLITNPDYYDPETDGNGEFARRKNSDYFAEYRLLLHYTGITERH